MTELLRAWCCGTSISGPHEGGCTYSPEIAPGTWVIPADVLEILHRDLTHVVNVHSIDARLNVPDNVLAGAIVNYLTSLGQLSQLGIRWQPESADDVRSRRCMCGRAVLGHGQNVMVDQGVAHRREYPCRTVDGEAVIEPPVKAAQLRPESGGPMCNCGLTLIATGYKMTTFGDGSKHYTYQQCEPVTEPLQAGE